MVEKPYNWAQGASLQEHSRVKHQILRSYFSRYIVVRCQLPQQQRFRLAVIDGFAGGGRYLCGEAGSPIIFIEELKQSIDAINTRRAIQGLGTIEIECLLVFNDQSHDAISALGEHVAPLHGEIRQTVPSLHLNIEYLTDSFEANYQHIKDLINLGRYRNVIFNLDQCGHSLVERATLIDIMQSYPSAEVFYTFAIEALLAFLNKSDPVRLAKQLGRFGIDSDNNAVFHEAMSNQRWLGAAERLVYDAFRSYALYNSPFSINNPDGWRYWLIHFANHYRARQEYNDILHRNNNAQAHFGRSGLNMLSYDPDHGDGSLYLFDLSGRENSEAQLLSDIPRFISEAGDAIAVSSFYESIYNATPAHTKDINSAIIKNPDIAVITKRGGVRRSAGSIAIDDVLKLNKQTSFFPMFSRAGTKAGDTG